jgi:hypothetical protein
MAKKFKALVELYDLVFTARKDYRTGRIVSTGSVKIADLIAVASKRSDISPQVMRAVYDLLRGVALEEVCSMKHVEFGLTHNRIGCEGIFIGDHPAWYPKENSLSLISVAAADVRETISKDVDVEVLGMASSGTYINSLTDAVSGRYGVYSPAGTEFVLSFSIFN